MAGRSFRRPIVPQYHIEDCRIFVCINIYYLGCKCYLEHYPFLIKVRWEVCKSFGDFSNTQTSQLLQMQNPRFGKLSQFCSGSPGKGRSSCYFWNGASDMRQIAKDWSHCACHLILRWEKISVWDLTNSRYLHYKVLFIRNWKFQNYRSALQIYSM